MVRAAAGWAVSGVQVMAASDCDRSVVVRLCKLARSNAVFWVSDTIIALRANHVCLVTWVEWEARDWAALGVGGQGWGAAGWVREAVGWAVLEEPAREGRGSEAARQSPAIVNDHCMQVGKTITHDATLERLPGRRRHVSTGKGKWQKHTW